LLADLKKCTESRLAAEAPNSRAKLLGLCFQNDCSREIARSKVKWNGALNIAETMAKYKIWAKCGDTAWASFAPTIQRKDAMRQRGSMNQVQ